jgi:hypothetical protein
MSVNRAVERPPPPPASRSFRPWRLLAAAIAVAVLVAVVAGGLLLWHEAGTSRLQARELARYAARLDYALLAGPSEAIRFPLHGPFDQRMGYTELPRFAERLTDRGYALTEQARFSKRYSSTGHGLFAPYREKTRAGLDMADCRGKPLYRFRYPYRGYERLRRRAAAGGPGADVHREPRPARRVPADR